MSAPFVAALMAVVDRTIAQWFADNPKHATWRRKCGARVRIVRTGRCSEMCGGSIQKLRRSSLRSFRTIVHGVRATAPCLHNGSVPTLQDMLTPQDERPKKFCVEAPQPRILADDW
jgi:hypothetical protein